MQSSLSPPAWWVLQGSLELQTLECTTMSWIELLHRCFRFVANAAAAGLPASSCTTTMSATSPDPGLHHHHHQNHHGFGLPHLLYPTSSFLTKDFSNLAAIITSSFGSFSSSPPFLHRERERERQRERERGIHEKIVVGFAFFFMGEEENLFSTSFAVAGGATEENRTEVGLGDNKLNRKKRKKKNC